MKQGIYNPIVGTINMIIMILAIGEILIDEFPGYKRAGGAPFNFVFHLKHLGLPVRLITRIGSDVNGQRLQQMLDRYGFEPTDIQIDPHHKTGVVKVALKDAGIPTFQIFPNVAYDYLQLDYLADDPIWQEVTLIYYGSLIQRSDIGFKQLGRLLSRRRPGMKCFCDINLRVSHYSRSSITQSLTYADILKLNDEELDEIRRILNNPTSSETFAEYLMSFFNIEMMAITHGAEGSTLVTEKRTMDIPPAPSVAIIDTVGAGDGYAAILALGTLLGLPLETIAATTTDFAAQICQLPGAVPEDAGFYDTWKIRLGEYL